MAKKKRRPKQPKPDLPLFDLDLPLRPDGRSDATDGSNQLDDMPFPEDEPDARPGPTELTLEDIEPLATSRGGRPKPEPLPLFPDPEIGQREADLELGNDSSREASVEDDDLVHEDEDLMNIERQGEEAENGESDAYQDDEPPTETARFRDRLLAGLADLSIIALAMALALFGVLMMRVPLEAGDQWPLGLLALTFSFLYTIIPLAFWGQTPGMAWLGLMTFGMEQEPLTFSQTLWRWVGSLLTLAFCGLPLLLTLRGDSLGDRLSRSQTVAL